MFSPAGDLLFVITGEAVTSRSRSSPRPDGAVVCKASRFNKSVDRRCVYSELKIKVILPLLPLELWAPCKARLVWAGAVIFASATCSLQFAKASAATLSQQVKNILADLLR